MNKFSIYQYLLIFFVLVLGFTYALPNLYPTQPSIQVAYTDSGRSADQILLNELEEILLQSNCTKIFLEVASNNLTALHLYKKAGFKKFGIRKNYYKILKDKKVDAILMEKVVNLKK